MALSKEEQAGLAGALVVAIVAAVIIVELKAKQRDLHMVCEYVMGGPLENEMPSDDPKTTREAVALACINELGLRGRAVDNR